MLLQKEVQKIEAAAKTIQAYLPRMTASKIIRNIFFYIWGGVLIVVPIVLLLSNLCFDLYYAVPEQPKYVKVAGSQVALEVNTQVNKDLEEESIARMEKINPKGAFIGVVANEITNEIQPLDVKGSLLAVETNALMGTVEVEPIYFTTAYQKGIQSSYETGIKYYDLDFNLNVEGFQNGLIANKSGDDGTEPLNLFTASLELVEQADQALRVDLNSFLNQSTDREYSLRSYLVYLNNIAESMENNQVKVEDELSKLSKEEEEARKTMKETESNFFVALNAFDENKSYEDLGQFVVDYQEQVDVKANLQAMNQIDKYLKAYYPVLTAKIEAVEANRQALVQGITVVAFRDVDLGLITSQ